MAQMVRTCEQCGSVVGEFGRERHERFHALFSALLAQTTALHAAIVENGRLVTEMAAEIRKLRAADSARRRLFR